MKFIRYYFMCALLIPAGCIRAAESELTRLATISHEATEKMFDCHNKICQIQQSLVESVQNKVQGVSQEKQFRAQVSRIASYFNNEDSVERFKQLDTSDQLKGIVLNVLERGLPLRQDAIACHDQMMPWKKAFAYDAAERLYALYNAVSIVVEPEAAQLIVASDQVKRDALIRDIIWKRFQAAGKPQVDEALALVNRMINIS